MRTMLSISACLLALTMSPSQGRAHTAHPAAPPVLGAWCFVGTAPPGFTRQGTEVARLTFSLERGRLHALVFTGKHRYNVGGQYVAARHELLVTVPASRGKVRLQATLGTGSAGAARMLGIWSDAHGDESDVDRLSPRTTLAGLRARVTVQPGAWLPFFPQRFLTRIYAKNGASRRVPLSLSQLVLAAMQGTTVRAPQFTL